MIEKTKGIILPHGWEEKTSSRTKGKALLLITPGHHRSSRMPPRNIHRQTTRGNRGSAKSISLALLAVSFLVSLLPFIFIFNQPISGRKEGWSTAISAGPPESLEEIEFCAEKCRYIPEMCSQNKYRDKLRLPAPKCLKYSTTVEGDIYWASHRTEDQLLNNERHNKTAQLVTWAAARARERRGESNNIMCEEIPTNNTAPMMFPEEL